jgi:sugar phosphate isomerase/epimerase
MLLSISNIAWSSEYDEEMYAFLRDSSFSGLEIAPTRIFPDKPYGYITEARQFAVELREQYGLSISSIQSIWYGRAENIFGSNEERNALIEYTKRAVEFAVAVECRNLVFGCPINRNIPIGVKNPKKIALDFFERVSGYAAENGTVIALEPNPPVYGTNFINTTEQAVELCKNLSNDGFKVNVDVGTMVTNNEPVSLIAENLDIVNHIHISEPGLVPIERREIHREIIALPFNRYVSVEMGNCGDLGKVKQVVEYVANLRAKQ